MMQSKFESNTLTAPGRISLLTIVFFGAVVLAGCGGGSSGTGETGVEGLRPSEGQIIDPSCSPVSNVDLPSLGLGTYQDVSGEDGSFTLDPDAPQQVPAPPGAASPELDRSQANCIVIVYDNGSVVSTNVYPLANLPECSVEGLQGAVPNEELPPCSDGRQS
jgi:hypothetical protein